MKKTLLISIILLTALIIPVIVSAAGPIESCTLKHKITVGDTAYDRGTSVSESNTQAWGMFCLLDAVYTVVDWTFYIIMAGVTLFTIWGAFDILTAAGEPEKVKKGQSRITYAMIGLVIALLSRAIPGIINGLMGVPSPAGPTGGTGP